MLLAPVEVFALLAITGILSTKIGTMIGSLLAALTVSTDAIVNYKLFSVPCSLFPYYVKISND
jgi:hypothetical protein